jgi:hypothetical protein
VDCADEVTIPEINNNPPAEEVTTNEVTIPGIGNNPPAEEVTTNEVTIPGIGNNPPAEEVTTNEVTIPEIGNNPPAEEVKTNEVTIPEIGYNPQGEEVTTHEVIGYTAGCDPSKSASRIHLLTKPYVKSCLHSLFPETAGQGRTQNAGNSVGRFGGTYEMHTWETQFYHKGTSILFAGHHDLAILPVVRHVMCPEPGRPFTCR